MRSKGKRPRSTTAAIWGAVISTIALMVTALGVLGAQGIIRLGPPPVPTATHAEPARTAPATSAPEPLARTMIRQAVPIDYDGELTDGYTIEGTYENGECFSESDRVWEGGNAYRCVGEKDGDDSGIFDPCFAMTDGAAVFCMYAPWDTEGSVINLIEPVTFDQSAVRNNQPPGGSWGIVLVDPDDPTKHWSCTLIVGSRSEYSGHTISYGCVDEEDDFGAALGDINADQPVWRVLFSDFRGTAIAEAEIEAAWY